VDLFRAIGLHVVLLDQMLQTIQMDKARYRAVRTQVGNLRS
jgi:hypothetical protein